MAWSNGAQKNSLLADIDPVKGEAFMFVLLMGEDFENLVQTISGRDVQVPLNLDVVPRFILSNIEAIKLKCSARKMPVRFAHANAFRDLILRTRDGSMSPRARAESMRVSGVRNGPLVNPDTFLLRQLRCVKYLNLELGKECPDAEYLNTVDPRIRSFLEGPTFPNLDTFKVHSSLKENWKPFLKFLSRHAGKLKKLVVNLGIEFVGDEWTWEYEDDYPYMFEEFNPDEFASLGTLQLTEFQFFDTSFDFPVYDSYRKAFYSLLENQQTLTSLRIVCNRDHNHACLKKMMKNSKNSLEKLRIEFYKQTSEEDDTVLMQFDMKFLTGSNLKTLEIVSIVPLVGLIPEHVRSEILNFENVSNTLTSVTMKNIIVDDVTNRSIFKFIKNSSQLRSVVLCNTRIRAFSFIIFQFLAYCQHLQHITVKPIQFLKIRKPNKRDLWDFQIYSIMNPLMKHFMKRKFNDDAMVDEFVADVDDRDRQWIRALRRSSKTKFWKKLYKNPFSTIPSRIVHSSDEFIDYDYVDISDSYMNDESLLTLDEDDPDFKIFSTLIEESDSDS